MNKTVLPLLFLGMLTITTGTDTDDAAAGELIKWKHFSSAAGDFESPGVGNQSSALLLDIDKDGKDEIVIAGWGDTSMVWYRKKGSTWEKYLMDKSNSHIEAGGVFHDIDGDGNQDIFCAEMVEWYNGENPGSRTWLLYGNGEGDFTIEQLKAATNIGNHESRIGDVDGDGRLDIVQTLSEKCAAAGYLAKQGIMRKPTTFFLLFNCFPIRSTTALKFYCRVLSY